MINDFSLSFKNKERGGEWGFIFFFSLKGEKGGLLEAVILLPLRPASLTHKNP